MIGGHALERGVCLAIHCAIFPFLGFKDVVCLCFIIVCVKQFYFTPIQFSIITLFISIWRIGRTLSGATTPGQSRPGSDGNDGVLHILQSFTITVDSPSDFLVLYPGHPLDKSYSLCNYLHVHRQWYLGLKSIHCAFRKSHDFQVQLNRCICFFL